MINLNKCIVINKIRREKTGGYAISVDLSDNIGYITTEEKIRGRGGGISRQNISFYFEKKIIQKCI